MTRAEWMERWAKQCAEWQAIAKSMEKPTAYRVSLEQRKRALARGERLVTYSDLEAASS